MPRPKSAPARRSPRHSNGHFAAGFTRFLKRILALFAMVALTVGGFYATRYIHDFVYGSDFFRVRDIRVLGASPALERSARETVDARLAAVDGNLCRLDVRQLHRELAALPRARHAELRRELPDGLMVQFIERKPLLIANLNEPALIDETGVVLDRIEPREILASGLPILTGIRTGYYELGQTIRQEGLDNVLQTVLLLREADPALSNLIVEWSLGSRNEICATLRSGTEVRFGDQSPLALLDKLAAALAQVEKIDQASYIDLRMHRQVIYKPLEG